MGNNYMNGNKGQFNGNKGRFNGNSYSKQNFASDYVGAPYNFVPLYVNPVSVPKEQLAKHDLLEDELLSGEISYSFKAETPVFISDGKKDQKGNPNPHFFKNEYGKYAIPGSSIRGLIRSNAQILGLANFRDDIDDYNLMYRNVAAGAEKDKYATVLGNKTVTLKDGKSVTVLKNVEAGYIAKRGSKYVIYKTKLDRVDDALGKMNYYVINERIIAEKLSDFPIFKEHPEYAQHDLKRPFRKDVIKGRVHYKGTANMDYKPGYHEVSYEVNGRHVTAVGEPGRYSKQGYLVGTGGMQEKKSQYIIPEIDKSKDELVLPENDVKAFKIDFESKKNTLKRFKNIEFFNLPKTENEVKPVFFIFLDGRYYFGFTPRLRLFYHYSIADGINQKNVEFDYAKSLFGTISNKVGYKSKVAFTDAIAYEVKEAREGKVVLAEPKPTSYYDYLKQTKGQINTYNTDGFEIRGVKQYWLHHSVVSDSYKGENDKIKSIIRPLAEGTIFKGTVRFHNLTKAELGLLVWSVKLNEESWQNVGMAKSYGFGAVSLKEIEVKVLDLQKAYSLSEELNLNPFENVSANELINAYKDEMNGKLSGKDIDSISSVVTFFDMKNHTIMPDEKKIRYMDLGAKEYQSRMRNKAPLQRVSELVKKKG